MTPLAWFMLVVGIIIGGLGGSGLTITYFARRRTAATRKDPTP